MTRQVLIEKEAENYYDKNHHSSTDRSFLRQGFEDGINSQLNKELQELAVIEGKIELLKYITPLTDSPTINKMSAGFETQRTELLNKLNLEG